MNIAIKSLIILLRTRTYWPRLSKNSPSSPFSPQQPSVNKSLMDNVDWTHAHQTQAHVYTNTLDSRHKCHRTKPNAPCDWAYSISHTLLEHTFRYIYIYFEYSHAVRRARSHTRVQQAKTMSTLSAWSNVSGTTTPHSLKRPPPHVQLCVRASMCSDRNHHPKRNQLYVDYIIYAGKSGRRIVNCWLNVLRF